MCVEFLTNSLPFADPTFLWNHHRNSRTGPETEEDVQIISIAYVHSTALL